MRHESYQQYAIVAADSAQELTVQLNAKLKELSAKRPTVTFEGMIARISYTETVKVPESLADEFELEGVSFRCEDCPLFEPILRPNGEVDKRVKYGNCPIRELGRTFRHSRTCDELYKMLKEGKVKLCLSE